MSQRIASLASWIFAAQCLTLDEAQHLSGFDRNLLVFLIEDGVVDAERCHGRWLVEKGSLREYQEALVLVAGWHAS